ncbi:MAG: hypothetical protein DME47_02640 [Verrucomicrobia bacterium]|nr:MAG: hypothetical protein DME47_02640 [Verrucomicrobiota bacterium]
MIRGYRRSGGNYRGDRDEREENLKIHARAYQIGPVHSSCSGERRLPGSARVSRFDFGVSPKQSLKVRETGTVSPKRETRALPGSLRSPKFGPRFSPFCNVVTLLTNHEHFAGE